MIINMLCKTLRSSPLLLTASLMLSGAPAGADVVVPAPLVKVDRKAEKKVAKAPPVARDQVIAIDPAVRAKSALYTDGKSHYIAVVPDEHSAVRLYYGDGKRLHLVSIEARLASGWDFQDPRFLNKSANPDFRGVDWRIMSAAERSKDEQKLDVRCGERHATFNRVADAEAQGLLASAVFAKTLRRWRPYALARDNTGVYYYVDRGYDEADPTGPKNFRLFVGPRGNLKQQKMTNVVSDSEGDIFSTKTGDLRLVLNRSESEWVVSGKSSKLLWVDPRQNLHMIFTDLGVYVGERLGTPCDDL